MSKNKLAIAVVAPGMEKPPKEPSPENIDLVIKKLLEILESYNELFNELSPELQDQWYDAEMEAKVGKDRLAATIHLQQFLKTLEKIKAEKK